MQLYKAIYYDKCICFVKDNHCFYIHIDANKVKCDKSYYTDYTNTIKQCVKDEGYFSDTSRFEKFNLRDLTEKEFEILAKAYQEKFNEKPEIQKRKVQEVQREQELPVDLL